MTDDRRRLHLGVFLGLSAGAYALSLAGVTALQARSEAAVAANLGPRADAISRLAAQNDALDADARRAGSIFDDARIAYDEVRETLADVEARLGTLATSVQAVDGAARVLPDRMPLPRVSRTVPSLQAPTVHATTAASGG
jgi:hypothetical protein